MIDRQNDAETEQTALEQEETFVAADEAQASPDAEPEAWQDELPPEDDFHDAESLPDETLEGGDGFEEGLEGAEPLDEAQGGIQGDKKRGKQILYGVFAVGALFIGGLMYLQFSGPGEETRLATPMAAVMDVDALSKEAKPAAPTQELYVTPTTGETDITALYKATQQQAATGGTALPSGLDSLGVAADKSSLGESTEIVTDSPVAPAPTIAKIENIPVPSPQQQAASSAPIPASLGEAEASNPNASLTEVESRISRMEEQMAALKKELDDALEKNIDLVKQLEAAQSASVATETQALEEKVKQLEQQLAASKEKQTSSKAKEETFHEQTGLFVDEQTPQPVLEKRAAKPKKATTKQTASRKKTRTKTETSSPASPSGWVLRAATPDAAWVSTSSHSAELRRVGVGESLPGIGRVVEIRENGGNWEVVGSSGTLR